MDMRRKQGRRGNGYGSVRLKGNTYYVRYTDARGMRQEVSAHTSSYQEALTVLATYTEPIRKSKSQDEIKLRLQQQLDVMELRKDVAKVERIRLDELADRFLAHRSLTDATSGTKANYRFQLKNLVSTIQERYPDVVYLDDVTLEVADAAMNSLTKSYSPAAYNLALATYRRVWGMYARSNPFIKIAKRKIDKSKHRMDLKEDDMRRIFAACRDAEERAVWGVAAYTGLRCGDVCCLTYGALGSGLETITWTPQKTKRHMAAPLVIPVCPPLKRLLLAVLDAAKIGNDSERDTPLWPDYKRRYLSRCHCDWFARTLNRAGLSVSHKEDGHRHVDTGFHVARHYFVTNASRYMSPFLVSKIAGQSTLKMTAHYYHASIDDMAAGLSQMPDFSAETPTGNKHPQEDAAELMRLLSSLKQDNESALDLIRRIAPLAKTYSSAS